MCASLTQTLCRAVSAVTFHAEPPIASVGATIGDETCQGHSYRICSCPCNMQLIALCSSRLPAFDIVLHDHSILIPEEEECCCRQARKLQEMFQKVQQENEMLRSGRRPVPQAPLAGSGPHFNSLLSPPHNVRHQNNTPGSGRVVRTSSPQ